LFEDRVGDGGWQDLVDDFFERLENRGDSLLDRLANLRDRLGRDRWSNA
jgi:hypothetical protein